MRRLALELLHAARFEQHGRHAPIGARQNRLHALRGGRFEAHVDAERAERALDELDALVLVVDVGHRLPLEGRLGLGHVGRQVDRHARAAIVVAHAAQDVAPTSAASSRTSSSVSPGSPTMK